MTTKSASSKLPAFLRQFEVDAGKRVRLKDHDPAWMDTREMRELGKDELRERAQAYLQQTVEELSQAQELLYANDAYSVLVVFQAMDAAGKDGTIKHVMSGINPQGCQVFSFKHPSSRELEHDFLWRTTRCLPERGKIGIFNRSYYEEVLIVRVHPEILAAQGLPKESLKDGKFWQHRFKSILDLEKHLHRNGTRIVKFFLHLSKDEQRKRFLARIDNPEKQWKFTRADLDERKLWKDYQEAYEACLSATSTKEAPWYAVPADDKKTARLIISQVLVELLEGLDLAYPKPSVNRKALAEMRRKLVRDSS
jgi:PPK2 family polyphosphate:nucleotide phosphotransferase